MGWLCIIECLNMWLRCVDPVILPTLEAQDEALLRGAAAWTCTCYILRDDYHITTRTDP